MATPDTHQAAQAAIAASAASLARRAWVDLDLGALKLSLPQLKLQIAAVIRRYSAASTTAAIQHYLQQRGVAGVSGNPGFNIPQPAPLEQIASGVEWAAQPLWGKSDTVTAERRLDSMVERLVLNAGRDMIVSAVEQDRAARGWARVPEPGACAFCALLSTRGAVYKSDETAGRNANDKVREIRGETRAFKGEGEFKFHDNCRCHVEPTFSAYEPPAQVRLWEADHARLRRENGSVSLSVWRAYYDATYLAADVPQPV